MAAAAVSCLIAGAALGYFVPGYILVEESYIPPVHIIGDVSAIVKVDKETLDRYEVKSEYTGDTRALSLEEIVFQAGPVSPAFDLYIIAAGGRTAMLSGDQLKDSYIAFGSSNGWEAINPNHPVSSNIKDIEEIVIVSGGGDGDFGLNIITMEENISQITPGSAYLESSKSLEFGGSSYKEGRDERFGTSVFREKHIIELEELTSIQPEAVVLMGSRGEYVFLKNSGSMSFEIDGNRFLYNGETAEDSIDDLKGIVLDPAAASIMDVYYDAASLIENGTDVLVIITDGMGYHQYEYAVENGYAPFMASAGRADMALSVYRPVTNAGLAAIFTGRPPSENGIYSRKQRIPETPTIWGKMLDEGLEGLLIEGDIQIIKTEVEAILNSDRDSDSTIDDEIFQAALQGLGSGADLMAVHFHSIDDSGHESGDLSEDTFERIREVDSYIRQLAEGWQGKIIIISDHGMHSTAGGGDHGQFRYEDVVVPYIMIDGGGL